MRLVTFEVENHTPRLGALLGEQVLDMLGAYHVWRQTSLCTARPDDKPPFFLGSLLAFLQAGEAAKALVAEVLACATAPEYCEQFVRNGLLYALEDVIFLPPLQRPGKIVCLGQNYRSHLSETDSPIPRYPVLFAQFANTLIGHRQPIVLPKVSQMVDCEAELAIVIGRRCKNLPATAAAFDAIAGYTIFNDVSMRDYQKRTSESLQGKTFDGSGPIGPALVTADEIVHPNSFEVMLRINGEVRQQANTTDFIFTIPTLLAYISTIMTLEPGDIIATGTPGGVGFARHPPVFLKPGDVVQIEISELGTLENRVIPSCKEGF